MSQTVDLEEARERLPELVSIVAEGDEVLIVVGGRTLAKLVSAVTTEKKRIAGLHEGAMVASPDFDEPLSDEFWEGK